MKKFLCKHRREAITLAVLLLSTLFSMGNTKRQFDKYIQSGQGNICQMGPLPAYCGFINTGVICTSLSGSATRTWYLNDCVTVYYNNEP